jgi:hypothetical protein
MSESQAPELAPEEVGDASAAQPDIQSAAFVGTQILAVDEVGHSRRSTAF